jgi:hypothetical protein
MGTHDRGRARHRPALAILAILALSVIPAACGSASSSMGGNNGAQPAPSFGGGSGSGSGSGAGGAPTAAPAGNGNNTAGGTGNGAPVVDAVRPDLLIVKTGTLALEVDDVDEAVADATSRIGGLGGYVSGSSQSGDAAQVTASITYRIPSARWEDALIALRDLASKVVTEQTQTDDVTAQVVDLGARVRNLQATERAIQEVMAKAVTIDEILDVQAELTRIRGEIEQAASAKAHFEEQATYSTLTVRFGLTPATAPSPSPSIAVAEPAFDPGAEVGAATESLVGILERLASVGIWFGIVWLPVLLVIGLLAVGVLWLARRLIPPLPGTVPPGN